MTIAGVSALAVLAVALGYGAILHFTCGVYPEDDAFITYRYVENIIAGHGPVYNVGQYVFGVSCPLYLAVLVVLKGILGFIPLPELAVRANFLPWLLAGVGMFFLLRRLIQCDWAAALVAAAFVVRDDLLRASTGGMESSLFVALMLWALWALAEERFLVAAALAGLSAPVRVEGALLCLLVGVVWLCLNRRRPATFILVLAAPSLVWTIFGLSWYGTPIYHSIVAKSRPLYPLPIGHALRNILFELDYRTLGNLSPHGTTNDPEKWHFAIKSAVLIALASLAAWGYLPKRLRSDESPPAVQYPLFAAAAVLFLLFLLFYSVANPLMFPWYYPPLMALWVVVLTAGVSRIAAGPRKTFLLASLCTFFAATTLFQPIGRAIAGRSFSDIGIESNPVRTRIAAYRAAAEWLNETIPADTTVLGPEIGSLGYYYRGRVLDACGLTSPEAVPFLPVPASERWSPDLGAIPLGLVKSFRPPVIVTMSLFASRSLYEDRWFRESYVCVRNFQFPQPVWGSSTFDVFIRADCLKR
jgi:hypothetical protein